MRRMSRISLLLTIVLVGVHLAGCGPASPAQSTQRGQDFPAARKTLSLGMVAEPGNLATNALSGGTKNRADDLRAAIHHSLAANNDRDEVVPQLAVEVPSVERGTWLLRPDGTMETAYRLRPNAQWHDGVPVTSRDFLFAWQVIMDPELPVASRNIPALIERIETPDDGTLVIEWKQRYALAARAGIGVVGPLPAHRLEEEWKADKDRFQVLGYWKMGFIGTGPFRLAEWEAGSHLVVTAFDQFYGGRPKIDSITYRFIPSSPTLVANLLSGDLDGAVSGVTLDEVFLVKEQWEQEGKAPSIPVRTGSWTFVSLQFREPAPRDLLDVRVRRALLHALDRQALVDSFSRGIAPVSHAIVAPDDFRYGWVRDAILQYPYDARRAQQLMEEVGWRRGTDGEYRDTAGERVTLPIWANASAANEQVVLSMSNYWKQAGFGSETYLVPPALQQDGKLRAWFPAADYSSYPGNLSAGQLMRVHSSLCPTEQSRWTGANRGCYRNAEMDRVVDSLVQAIDVGEQRGLFRELVRMQTEDLPVLPITFVVSSLLFRDGILSTTFEMENMHEWDIR